VPPSGSPQKCFQEGKNDILLVSFSFQVADDATQIDVREMLYPFCAIKKWAMLWQQLQTGFSLSKFTLS